MTVIVEGLGRGMGAPRLLVGRQQAIKRAALKLLKLSKIQNGYLEIYLVGNDFMNKNVLAFPAPKNFFRPDIKSEKPLGEIYLNPQYIKKRGENLMDTLTHGFLHLLGYDHKKNRDRMRMEKKEKTLLRLLITLKV